MRPVRLQRAFGLMRPLHRRMWGNENRSGLQAMVTIKLIRFSFLNTMSSSFNKELNNLFTVKYLQKVFITFQFLRRYFNIFYL